MQPSFIIFFVFCIARGLSLSCLPCNEVECEDTGSCPYGVGSDICGCCETCLKGPDEECGGIWNYLGSCGEGLECELESEYNSDYIGDQPEGTCVYSEESSTRMKRASRRAGKKLIKAKTHKHLASGGISESILKKLKAKGLI